MKHCILLLLGVFFWTSCEMPLHDNFVEIGKPDKELQIGMYLDVQKEGETIVIYKPTQVGYIMKALGKQVDMAYFQMGDKAWSVYEEEGSFYVGPENFPDGTYSLICQLYSKTNTGSLADQVDREYYVGEIVWPVEIKYELAPEKALTASVGADGYMNVSWNKPYLNQKQFLKYEVYGNGGLLAAIENIDQPVYVDRGYVGGAQSYSVRVVFSDEGKEDAWDIGFVSLENNVEFTVDRGIEHSRISWTAPANHHCIATLNGEPLLTDEKNTCVEFPSAGFGATGSDLQRIDITLVAESENDRTDDQTVRETFSLSSAGSRISENSLAYGYIKGQYQLFYTDYSETVRALNLSGLSVDKEYKRTPYAGFFSLAEGENTAYVAAYSFDEIDVLDAGSFTLKKRITGAGYLYDPVYLTSADRVVYLQRKGIEPLSIEIYSLPDDRLELSVPLDERWNESYAGKKLVASPDGRYLAALLTNTLRLIRVGGGSVEADQTYSRPFETFLFNPVRPEEIYLADAGIIYVLNREDFTPIREIPVSGMKLSSADPLTGNLLVYNETELNVIDPQDGTVLFSMKNASEKPLLAGNTLLDKWGLVLNIESWLEK